MESSEQPYFGGMEDGELNINAAEKLLGQAQEGRATDDEVNEMIATLQDLQNQGYVSPKIQATLAGLISSRKY